jgi:6,7-dimethyl-8-ribityllumazine synthase
MKFLIVTANFYEDIAAKLLDGATRALREANVSYDMLMVAGALEIPAAIAMACNTEKYAGYVALGCVIRGETFHFDVVCNESARGLMQLAIEHKLAIGNGIITVENEAQANARADMNQMNKGGAAAKAALRMVEIKKQFSVV